MTVPSAYTIRLNGTMGGTDLNLFAASSAQRLLGINDCFAYAVRVPASSSTLPLVITSSTPATAGTQPSTLTSLSAPTSASAAPHRIPIQGKIVLSVVLSVVTVGSIAAFTLWIRHKRRKAALEAREHSKAAVKEETTLATSLHTKPELDANNTRYEMEGERERQELAAEQAKYELDATDGRDDGYGAGSRSVIQELRLEPSHEMDVQCK